MSVYNSFPSESCSGPRLQLGGDKLAEKKPHTV